MQMNIVDFEFRYFKMELDNNIYRFSYSYLQTNSIVKYLNSKSTMFMCICDTSPGATRKMTGYLKRGGGF